MEHKQVPCVWIMSYSQQQASIVWSGHWCTLLQCIFSDPIHLSCPKPWPAFPTSDGVAPLFCVQWVVIDIGGIVDHYCFNFLFIILYFFFPSRPNLLDMVQLFTFTRYAYSYGFLCHIKKHTFSKPIIFIDWYEKKVYKQW